MASTGFGKSIARGHIYQPVDPTPVSDSDWQVRGIWLEPRPNSDIWWAGVRAIATVDPGITGEVRMRAASTGDTSTPVTVSAAGVADLGWLQLEWGTNVHQPIIIEARRTVGTGGGIRIKHAALTMMTSPPGETVAPGDDFPYPDWTGTVTTVGAAQSLQGALDASTEHDRIIFEGDHTWEGKITIPHAVDLQGSNRLESIVEQLETSGAQDGLWLTNFTIFKDGVVGATREAGFNNPTGTGGALTHFRFSYITIRGFGLNDGFQLNRRYDNDRGVIHNTSVYEIQNIGYELFCDNLRTWGIRGHDNRRTVDLNIGDVDVLRFAGSNQIHSGFWFYSLHEFDSISDESPGKDVPFGPLGSYSSPHNDGAQTFDIKKADNTTSWLTKDILFEDGIIDYRRNSGPDGGSGGRQAFIFENNNSAGDYNAERITIRRVAVATVGNAPIVSKGVRDLTVEDCSIWLTSTESEVETQFRTYSGTNITAAGGGGPTDNPNLHLLGNRVYAEEAGQEIWHGTQPTGFVNTSSFEVADPPFIAEFVDGEAVIITPTEAEVEAWLTAA